MSNGLFLYFTVKLSVADYKSDQVKWPPLLPCIPKNFLWKSFFFSPPPPQIHHLSTFEKAFHERCNHYEMCEGVAKVLNLDNFAQSPEFDELIFTLGNKSSLTLLCSTLTKHCDIFKVVNGIRLSNNQIMDLTPFAAIPVIDIQMVDLRNNKVSMGEVDGGLV